MSGLLEALVPLGEAVDRGADADERVDVIVPVLGTNDLWKRNLTSIYREIPVNRLLLGDAGSQDATVEIARRFPRVEVIDHAGFTLGFALRDLIHRVETEFFVYLHADVYLPPGWYDAMAAHRDAFDWFECHRRFLHLIHTDDDPQYARRRAYSGSQMGRTSVLREASAPFEDDHIVRSEDILLQYNVENAGGRYGKVPDTFHIHELELSPHQIASLDIQYARDRDPAWISRSADEMVRSIVKYAGPDDPDALYIVRTHLRRLRRTRPQEAAGLRSWVGRASATWDKALRSGFRRRLLRALPGGPWGGA